MPVRRSLDPDQSSTEANGAQSRRPYCRQGMGQLRVCEAGVATAIDTRQRACARMTKRGGIFKVKPFLVWLKVKAES